jgi:riboflavin kinase/FMN adenylyltransferase
MEYFTKPEQLASIHAPLFLAIGTFDGVHLGHRRVIQNAVHQANLYPGGRSGIITFHPHPLDILAPDHAPVAISTHEQRLQLFQAEGVDFVLDFAFSLEFAHQTPAEFVDSLLRHCPLLCGITVGSDWKFGRDRAGNVALLREIGRCQGFTVDSISTVTVQGCAVKSTRIRNTIRDGNLAKAHILLGRPYSVAGKVVHGRKLGRKLDMPTANIALQSRLLPPPGVLLVETHIQGIPSWKRLPGIANLGRRPTVNEGQDSELLLEVHLLNWDGDLYDQNLQVSLIHRLREEKKFNGLDELKEQIRRDRNQAMILHEQLRRCGYLSVVDPEQLK